MQTITGTDKSGTIIDEGDPIPEGYKVIYERVELPCKIDKKTRIVLATRPKRVLKLVKDPDYVSQDDLATQDEYYRYLEQEYYDSLNSGYFADLDHEAYLEYMAEIYDEYQSDPDMEEDLSEPHYNSAEAKTERIKRYKDQMSKYKVVKVSWKKIIKEVFGLDTTKIIEDAVTRVNKIVIHTYNFIKYYACYCLHHTDTVPVLNESDILGIMKLVATPKVSKASYKPAAKYADFYDKFYSKTIGDEPKVSYKNLSRALDNEAKSMYTAISNHIQEHFEEMLNRYINILIDLDGMKAQFKKDKIKNVKYEMLKDFRLVKQDILYNRKGNDAKASTGYDHIKQHFQERILKDFKIVKSLSYMASESSMQQRLLVLLMRMSIESEQLSDARIEAERLYAKKMGQPKTDPPKKVKVINAFPLRTNIKPKYVMFESKMIVELLMSEKITGDNKQSYVKAVNDNKDYIWSKFFNTHMRAFRKKGYKFDHKILTDGVGVSIVFIRSDLFGLGNKKAKTVKKPDNYKEFYYINEIDEDQRKELVKKDTVGGDPGIENIFFATNGEVTTVTKKGKVYRKAKTFSYSQGRRKFECKTNVYKMRLEKLKNTTMIGTRSVSQIESTLSEHTASSCILNNVEAYMKAKNAVNRLLFDFYTLPIHRIRKWYAYLNKERSESKMMDRFEQTFGGPNDTVMLMGDWSSNSTMKFQEPTKGKSTRRLFRNRGYDLFLVNEYNTSRRLYQTGEELVKFLRDKNDKKVHRVLGSKKLNEERTMSESDRALSRLNNTGLPTIINRDLNGSLNIRLKGKCIIEGRPIPSYMKRAKKDNDSTGEGPYTSQTVGTVSKK